MHHTMVDSQGQSPVHPGAVTVAQHLQPCSLGVSYLNSQTASKGNKEPLIQLSMSLPGLKLSHVASCSGPPPRMVLLSGEVPSAATCHAQLVCWGWSLNGSHLIPGPHPATELWSFRTVSCTSLPPIAWLALARAHWAEWGSLSEVVTLGPGKLPPAHTAQCVKPHHQLQSLGEQLSSQPSSQTFACRQNPENLLRMLTLIQQARWAPRGGNTPAYS